MMLSQEEDIEVIDEAVDGVTAAEVVGRCLPDVILMDERMPKSDGIQACLELKGIAPTARIIMLTVSENDADLYAAVKAGASGYLLKDAPVDDVAYAIRVVAAGQSLISPPVASKLLAEFRQLARSDASTRVPAPPLTDRELEVLRFVSEGVTNQAIAGRLAMSETAVTSHVRNMVEKLQLHSRMEAALSSPRAAVGCP